MSDNSPADDLENDVDPFGADAPTSGADGTGDAPETMLDAVADSVDLEFEADSDLDVEKELADAQARDEDAADPRDSSEAGTQKSKQPETQDAKADEEDDEDLGDEPDEQEMDGYKPRTRRRIEKLLNERNELRQERSQYAPFVEAMQHHDISNQDMSMLLGVGAALRRGDFEAFLAGVQPYVQQAQQMLGHHLPQDLYNEVQRGLISPQAARELAQRRAYAQHSEAEQERRQQQDQVRQQHEAATQVRTTISDWEASVKARDPDYPLKADAVRRYAQALIQERGLPRSTDEAVAYAEEAYREVNAFTNAAQPRRGATRPSPNSVQSSNAHGARSEPSSLMDAAMRGLADATGA